MHHDWFVGRIEIPGELHFVLGWFCHTAVLFSSLNRAPSGHVI